MPEHGSAQAPEPEGIGPGGSNAASGFEPRGPHWTVRLVLLVVGLLCLESGLFLAFAAGRMTTSMFIGSHLGLCAATATLGRWWIARSSTRAAAKGNAATVLQLAAWTALAGPFGTLVAVGLVVPRRADASHAGGASGVMIATGQGSELSRLELLHGSLLDRRLRLENAHSIRPLLDVVVDGTQIEKLDALGLISKRYVPALAPALRRALEDKDAAVRVLAATVMAQQHNAHTKRIGALQTIARSVPENSQHWSDLGQAHLDYAESGLLERSRAEAETTQARGHLQRAERLEAGIVDDGASLDATPRMAAVEGEGIVSADDVPNGHECRATAHGS
jgi:hypothetical protein